MSQHPWIIGIDFGTSNTAAAHTNPVKHTIEAVSLSHNRTTMVSSVFVETPDQIDVGEVAYNKAVTNPAAFVAAPKRVISQPTVQAGAHQIPPSALVAAVLAAAVERVTREHAGAEPAELVLTHPEAWSGHEISVLNDAAATLRLHNTKVTTISEPQAAAHYYSRAQPLQPGQRIAVFDFGGGTLDSAVLEAQADGQFTVIAARGDNALGGRTFDAVLRKWVDEQLDDRHPELLEYFRTRAPLHERQGVEESVRRAKELLSETAHATVMVSGGGETERFQITRTEFEELISPVLDRAVALTERTLADAGITEGTELAALYLTGGSSRIPLVQERLKQFGPIATLDDPKTVVAQGAIAAVTGHTDQLASTVLAPTGLAPTAAESAVNLTPQVVRVGTQPVENHAANHTSIHAATPARKTTKTPVILAVTVAAAALLLAGGFGAVRLFNTTADTHSSQPDTAAQSGVTGLASPGGGAHTESVDEDAEEKSLAVNTELPSNIPDSMRGMLENCFGDIPSRSGFFTLMACDIKPSSPQYAFFASEDPDLGPQMNIAVHKAAAAAEMQYISNGGYNMPGGQNSVTTTDAGNAVLRVFQAEGENTAEFQYANSATGLILSSYDMKDNAATQAMLVSIGAF